jgi:hypothetical protein
MTQKRRRLALALSLVVWGVVPGLGETGLQLFLKDGSYQLVKSYEERGDRVRYYSLERSAWEEVPLALVDLEATRRAQQEQEETSAKTLQDVREMEKQRFDLPPNTGFEVAPGVRLPPEQGVFAYNGQRVVHLVQSPGEVVKDKKRLALMLALPAPVLKSRSLVVLAEAHAVVRFLTAAPVFYIQLTDTSAAKWVIISLKPGKDNRRIETVESRGGKGEGTEVRTLVEAERAELSPGLVRLKPVRELPPGEYALGECVGAKLSLDVWDFGVDKPSPK